MNNREYMMTNEEFKQYVREETGENEQYGKALDLVLEQSKYILINDKVGNIKKMLIILSGLIFSISSGASIAHGELLFGVLGSLLAATVIEFGLLL